MKSRQKSKPKQRTNWKQRALHCEEVIKIQGVVAESREKWVDSLSEGVKYWEKRAESAEKHNALLLEERDDLKKYNVNSERERTHWYELYVNGKRNCDLVHNKLPNAPTRWQLLKSFLKHWYVELLCLMVVLSTLACYVAFVWKQGG